MGIGLPFFRHSICAMFPRVLGPKKKAKKNLEEGEHTQICMPCNDRTAKRRWNEFGLRASTLTDTFAEELNQYSRPRSQTLLSFFQRKK